MDVSPRILITAGPTHEPIDAVRYIGNRSSGRVGIGLAEEASRRGFSVTLLLGPTHLAPSSNSHLSLHRFRTTADLAALLAAHWPQHDILIMAAAVADFRPQSADLAQKLRRTDASLSLELEPTPDLLASLPRRNGQVVVGFALEPADMMISSAQQKLKTKRLDAIVANPLETIDSLHITAALLHRDGQIQPAPQQMQKAEFAGWLLDALEITRPVV